MGGKQTGVMVHCGWNESGKKRKRKVNIRKKNSIFNFFFASLLFFQFKFKTFLSSPTFCPPHQIDHKVIET